MELFFDLNNVPHHCKNRKWYYITTLKFQQEDKGDIKKNLALITAELLIFIYKCSIESN
jgi:hypothetical protein